MRTSKSIGTILLMVLCTTVAANLSRADETPLKALIINGQMNASHDWQVSSPIMKQILEQTGLFKVGFATSPPKGGNMEDFKPDFSGYNVVILDYDGEDWSEQTKTAFVEYASIPLQCSHL